jgi:hypothetical protein
MKNLVKRIGNLNRARSAKVPLLIAAIVAVIGVTMAVCSTTGTANRGDPAPSNAPATLTITGLDNYAGNYIVARMSGNDKDNIVAAADIGTESYYAQGYPAIGGLIEMRKELL